MAPTFKFVAPTFRLITAALAVAGAFSSAFAPSIAHAEPDFSILYTVDNPSDVGGGACNPFADDDCSLRSAIQQANAYSGVAATLRIRFQSDYDIALTGPLPVITHNFVDISAFDGVITRTVRVQGNGTSNSLNGNVFQILGDGARIDGLRFYGAATGWSNVFVVGTAKNAMISNNWIGAWDSGACPSATSYGGIFVNSTGAIDASMHEARAWIWGNVIRCSAEGTGVEVNNTNRVYLGQDTEDNKGAAQRNTISGTKIGVKLSNNANFNYVGNSVLANNGLGLQITGNSYNNFATSNLIADNQTGVLVDGGASFNLVGVNSLSSSVDANIIRSNVGSGVVISGTATNGNSVHGNVIGRGSSSDPATYGNGQFGVRVTGGANGNFIGFSSPSFGSNTIGGNGTGGVTIENGAHDNQIVGNWIGAASGDMAIPNNLAGVLIQGNTSTANTVRLNLINRNVLDGLVINGARNNTIGESNVISNNGRNGVVLSNGAQDNEIRDQSIYSNTLHGVLLTGATTTGNQLKQLNVFHNAGDGVAENDGAHFNTWYRLTTIDNSGLGIDKAAAVDTENTPTTPVPVITSVTRSGGNITFSGTASTSPSPTSFNLVDVFQVGTDPSGFGEGIHYVGSTFVDRATGTWTLTVASATTACFTAYQTYSPGGGVPAESSEFGANTCRVMLPIVRRD